MSEDELYKIKYLKYKNKYLELKNNNEMKGGYPFQNYGIIHYFIVADENTIKSISSCIENKLCKKQDDFNNLMNGLGILLHEKSKKFNIISGKDDSIEHIQYIPDTLISDDTKHHLDALGRDALHSNTAQQIQNVGRDALHSNTSQQIYNFGKKVLDNTRYMSDNLSSAKKTIKSFFINNQRVDVDDVGPYLQSLQTVIINGISMPAINVSSYLDSHFETIKNTAKYTANVTVNGISMPVTNVLPYLEPIISSSSVVINGITMTVKEVAPYLMEYGGPIANAVISGFSTAIVIKSKIASSVGGGFSRNELDGIVSSLNKNETTISRIKTILKTSPSEVPEIYNEFRQLLHTTNNIHTSKSYNLYYLRVNMKRLILSSNRTIIEYIGIVNSNGTINKVN